MSGSAGRGSSSGGLSPGAAAVLNLVVAAAWGAAGMVLFHVYRSLRRRALGDVALYEVERPPWWVTVIVWLIIFATIALPVALLKRSPANDGGDQDGLGSDRSGSSTNDLSQGRPTTPSIWILVGLAAGAGTAAFFLYRGKTAAAAPTEKVPLPEEIVRLVDETIDDLRTDPDLRRSIIRAYVRMESAFASAGVPRRPSETPFEYIDTALRRLMVPAAPVRGLTDLFEVARFSEHPLDASMKARAIDCLLEIRHALSVEVA